MAERNPSNKLTMKGYCEICGVEIEVRICCSGHMCGCMGQPIDPPVCSDKCYDKFMNKNPYELDQTQSNVSLRP